MPECGSSSLEREPHSGALISIDHSSLQEVMERPVILSDGYTYEADAIRKWLNSGKKV